MAKVAIVAVHGVADQQPSSSARSIADLLCKRSGFRAFTEVALRVPRKPMLADKPPGDDPALQFMHEQLDGYEHDDVAATYDTIRLDSTRDGDDVHVHEVYWADLSRPGESWYRIISELYQLVLHLPSLGRHTTDQAYEAEKAARAAKNEKPHKAWPITVFLQRACVAMLTIPIALLNLFMAALALIIFSALIPDGAAQRWTAVAVIVVGAAAVCMALPRISLVARWTALPFVVAVAAVAAWLALRGAPLYKVLAIEAVVVGGALAMLVSMSYEKMRRHATRVGALLLVVTVATASWFIGNAANSQAGVDVAAMHAFQWLNLALKLSWALLLLGGCVVAITGWVAARTSLDRVRSRRAMWTARFSLAFPAALFGVITTTLWRLIAEVIAAAVPVVEFKPQPVPTFDYRDAPAFLHEFFGWQVIDSAARGLFIFAVFLALFFLVATFAVGPSVVYEIKHPPRTADSVAAGRFLSRGIRWVAAAGYLPTISFFVLLAVGFWISQNPRALLLLKQWTAPVLYATAGGLGLLLTVKRFSTIFRAAMDVLLDVDNYLRMSPSGATPRAQIAERYVSLLRHLCREQYDRIVIVAHSQGTVITTDLLRYLNAVRDPELAELYDTVDQHGNVIKPATIEVRLFTMGSPLKQLYAAAFPHLYWWVDDDAPPELTKEPPWLDVEARPAPKELVVKRWVNAYRTGDYVGRNLWLDEKRYAERLYVRSEVADEDKAGQRAQICCGAGAHTHYWDRNAGDIATELEKLV